MCCRKVCIRTLSGSLVEILEREINQYHDLVDLLDEQSELLSAHDIKSSAEIQKREDTVVLRIKTLEEGRKAVVLRIAEYFGVPSNLITLERLIKFLSNSSSQKYAICRSEMLSLIERLENLDAGIAGPTQEKLHYINSILRSFMAANSAA